MLEKLSESAIIFSAPKKLYTISLPSEISEEYILEEFGRKENVNLNYNGRPIRIHEGNMTYYVSDGGFARQLMSTLAEDAKEKKKAKEKIIMNPEMTEIQFEEVKND